MEIAPILGSSSRKDVTAVRLEMRTSLTEYNDTMEFDHGSISAIIRPRHYVIIKKHKGRIYF